MMSGTKIIADTCSNHEGKWDNIRTMIDQLEELKIDYVKFQLFTADKLNPRYPNYEEWYKRYKETELSETMVKNICEHCYNTTPLFTLFDEDKAEMLRKYSDIVKIASPDCNNWNLLDTVFSLFDKVIISTGMHMLCEIETMLQRYKRYHKNIVLMYCKSQYPAEYTVEDKLRMAEIYNIAEKYKTKFGISDHGNITSYAHTADYYEHHFTLEKTGKPDDKVSWTIQEFADFIGLGDEYENRIKYKSRWL